MGMCFKLGLVLVTGTAILAGICLKCAFKEMEVPVLDEPYWGVGKQPAAEDTSIRPFKINIPDKVLEDLKDRLNKARPFVQPLEGIQQQYGMNTNLLKEIVDYWKTKYDWRAREKFLNQYPQFKTKIQGLDIHFMHIKPEVKNMKVYPLLMAHGWPGSVREFYETIPFLTKPQKGRDYVFELIIPALPGYGFSQAAAKPGMTPTQIGIIFKNLMRRLGHQKFYLQGGDWGSLITSNMAAIYGEHVLGVHNNMCFVNTPLSNLKMFLGSFWPSMIVDEKWESRMYPISKIFKNFLLEFGYMHIQSTKPDTVGVGLNDSPAGLAAYIIEKFTTWTNEDWKERADGGLKEKFTFDKLLDNIMYYWVTNSITTSMRLYSEAFNSDYYNAHHDWIPIKVPSGCAQFRHELAYTPECLIKERYQNLLQFNHFDDGGHFIAFEEPQVLANDVYDFVDKVLLLQKQKTN